MEIVEIGAFVVALLLAPWVGLVVIFRRGTRQRAEQDARWAESNRRIFALEQQVKKLRTERAQAPAEIVHKPVTEETRALPMVVVEKPVVPEVLSPTEQQPVAAFVPEPKRVPAEPVLTPIEAAPSWWAKLKGGLDLEEALGSNWLNKIGIVILVIGVAFFLAYQVTQFGPAGKVGVGFVVSAALLAGGIFLGSRERYRVFGLTTIGGGWALAFFTTYSMYHVAATKVLESQAVDLVLMLAVASAMVIHTLRYKSQVVTGFAFLLAFSTLTVSQVTVYSLVAGAILSLGLVAIVLRMSWFALEAFGVAAVYADHWVWVRRIIEPMGEHRHPFPEFLPSAGMLLFYWAIFRFSYIVRKPTGTQERTSAAAAVLNSVGLILLLKYQSIHPEWGLWALLVLGSVECLLGRLPQIRNRRPAFLLLTTVGILLLLAAIPLRLSGGSLDAVWIVQAESLLVAGIVTREVLYRRMAMLAALGVFIGVLSLAVIPLAGLRYEGFAWKANTAVAVGCVAAAAMFFVNSHWVTRRWPQFFEHRFDKTVFDRSSYAGAILLCSGLWALFPGWQTAPVWALAGLALMYVGARFRFHQLPLESRGFFGAALALVLWSDLPEADLLVHGPGPLLGVLTVAFCCYVTSYWAAKPEQRGIWAAAYRWAGSGLLLLLTYYALRSVAVAPATALLSLLLVEAGVITGLKDVRRQAYLFGAAAFATSLFVNLNSEFSTQTVSLRLYTMAIVAASLYYLYFRLSAITDRFETRLRVAPTAAWCGALTALAMLRFELGPDWVSSAWAAGATLLLGVAVWSSRDVFLHQGVFLCFAATTRAGLHNLYERSYIPAPFVSGPVACTCAVAILLLAGLPFAFRLRNLEPLLKSRFYLAALRILTRRPEQVFFFLPLGLIVALLFLEMRSGLVTLSLSALGVLVFLVALMVGERSFRLAGLGLLLLGVGKVCLVDVWKLGPTDRYLTLIFMGSALLLVSFLYSRYRETIRRFL